MSLEVTLSNLALDPRSAFDVENRTLRLKVGIFKVACLTIREIGHAAPIVGRVAESTVQDTIVEDEAGACR